MCTHADTLNLSPGKSGSFGLVFEPIARAGLGAPSREDGWHRAKDGCGCSCRAEALELS